jgi:hypothetical protein
MHFRVSTFGCFWKKRIKTDKTDKMDRNMDSKTLFAAVLLAVTPLITNAGLLGGGTWDGWSQAQSATLGEDQTGSFNYLDPGYGGQKFDAEYFFYKFDGHRLSIGLQAGFDLIDGHQLYGNEHYWAGDIAMTLNGVEYAVDFGLGHCGWSERGGCVSVQSDSAGIYENVSWDDDVVTAHSDSLPFAMASGDWLADIVEEGQGSASVDGELSYYRQFSLDVAALGLGSEFDLDLHWTMSCGNDAIDAYTRVAVPEPATLVLLAFGLVGLIVARRKN